MFRHFGVAKRDYFWHWGLAVGDDIYEVAAGMGVMGPKGIVASNTYVEPYNTEFLQFHGWLPLDTCTYKSDDEIVRYIQSWIRTHPEYNAWGPNCQTFSEDFHVFLTGSHLPFAKFQHRYHKNGGEGPERDPRVVWNDVENKNLLQQFGSAAASSTRCCVVS